LKGRHEIAVSKVLRIYGFGFSIFGTSGVISTIQTLKDILSILK